VSNRHSGRAARETSAASSGAAPAEFGIDVGTAVGEMSTVSKPPTTPWFNTQPRLFVQILQPVNAGSGVLRRAMRLGRTIKEEEVDLSDYAARDKITRYQTVQYELAAPIPGVLLDR
jgi:hypothetical protein